MIGHDPHELAAFLSAVLQGYTRQSAQAELARVFAAQYQLTLTEEVEIRYRTETSTDPETGETTSEEVPYEYYILNVKLTSKPISAVASELLTPEQMEMYQVYRQTVGNKPLLFGGGSPDMSNSEDLTGVQFVNGTRPGNPQLVELAKRQVGNVGGYPYWSWYGFDSRVEWCACFVSWCYNQAGKSEPRFAGCSVYELAGCKKPMKRLWISSMEDSAIREGFANLRPGADYDGLRDAALCRAKADWLVGINATRLFSVLYHRTLNIGRVMSPTLALIVQREAEIDTFQSIPFYTVALELPGLTVSGERMADKVAAEQLKEACQGANVTIKKVECKEKSEKPPALYDLTTLQRDANRLLGFTAQQTLDYLQSLYEKKLCTYPRTDSRYLTGDMADSLPVLVNLVANAMPFRKGIAITCDPQTVINDKKVTDHHAVIPTRNLKDADLSALPAGEKAVLELVALRLMCAVAQPHIYSETVVIAACAGGEFTTKGKTVKHPGWKALEDAYRAKMKDTEPKKEGVEKALPELTEGQTLSVSAAIVKEGKSSPPQHFTEDTLLSAMETAGKEDMPEDAERKGLGTPATRAGILEKLVSAGFLERKKSRKTVQLLPSHDAVSLITVLPEQLQSPLLTAEWEYRLGEIERGQLTPEEFLAGISTMLKDLVGTYQIIKGTEYLFTPPREVVGKCPRCGGEVAELQKGFFCQNDSCKFAIWKNNKWWAAKKKEPTKAVVSALLNDGCVRVTGLYSEKTGKTYDATVVLEDDGQYANFKLEFDQRKGGSR